MSNPDEEIIITRRQLWKGIWLADNPDPIKSSDELPNGRNKVSDFLRSLLPNSSPSSSKGVIKYAIIIGHNEKSPGAYAPYPVGKSEFVFNSSIASRMLKLADNNPNVQVKVFKRKKMSRYSLEIDECYRRVNAWLKGHPKKKCFALELHFNWLSGAGRVEMIHYPNSQVGKYMAGGLLEKFARLMGAPVDKTKLITRGKNERGGRSLWACSCPIVMPEPFDCTNNYHLLRVDQLGEEVFAETYMSLIPILD